MPGGPGDLNSVLQIPRSPTGGPGPQADGLGIEINSCTGQLRLPDDKLHHLQAILQEWEDWKVCTRKELESLIVLLNHTCKVVRSGWSFLGRMINLLHATHRPRCDKALVHLNTGFRADLAWWQEFLPLWNGGLVSPLAIQPSDQGNDHGCLRVLGLRGLVAR